MKPGAVVLVEAKRAAEEEERSDYCIDRRVFDIVVTLAYTNSLIHQHGTHLWVRDRARWLVHEMAGLQYDSGLNEHEGQERGDKAIRFDRLTYVADGMPQLVFIQNGHGRIHLGEEEFGTAFDELMGEESGSSGVMRR